MGGGGRRWEAVGGGGRQWEEEEEKEGKLIHQWRPAGPLRIGE